MVVETTGVRGVFILTNEEKYHSIVKLQPIFCFTFGVGINPSNLGLYFMGTEPDALETVSLISTAKYVGGKYYYSRRRLLKKTRSHLMLSLRHRFHAR